jgi:ABC-type branched-subunit amino acid transport system permease subunit
MSSAQLFYVINLLIYAGVDIIACLGLSQQFGVAGITNFGFIIFQAAGAYTAAILSLPSQGANGGFQSYIGGWNLPWPIWSGGGCAATSPRSGSWSPRSWPTCWSRTTGRR